MIRSYFSSNAYLYSCEISNRTQIWTISTHHKPPHALFCHFLMRSLDPISISLRLPTEEWWPLLYPLLGGHLFCPKRIRNDWQKNHGQNAFQSSIPCLRRLFSVWRYWHLSLWFGRWTRITLRQSLKLRGRLWVSKLHVELRTTTSSAQKEGS